MLKRQLHIFLTAVMFYTRIPCPKWVTHSEEYLNKATIYFPVMGWLVGSVTTLILLLGLQIWSLAIALILSIIGGILLTGAFHEDGFADVCDGFGGGWTQTKILEIMKDSRVGAYGVIGMIGMVGLKYVALYQAISILTMSKTTYLSTGIAFLLLIGHTLSRFTAVTILYRFPYARANEDSKAKPVAKQLAASELLIALGFTLIPIGGFIYWQQSVAILWLAVPLLLLHIGLGRYFMKWIGGYTGDCLGATQQLAEVIVYLCFANNLWKFF